MIAPRNDGDLGMRFGCGDCRDGKYYDAVVHFHVLLPPASYVQPIERIVSCARMFSKHRCADTLNASTWACWPDRMKP